MGNRSRDAGNRRARVLAVLLAALTVAALLPSAASALARPENLVAPSISGDPRVGGTLTCDRGRWDDTAGARYDYDFFWVRDFGDAIDGAYASTHVVTAADAGVQLLCVVHALNGQLDSYQESDALAGRLPEARTGPRLTGPARLGGELRCSRGVWDDRDLAPYATTFAWLRDDEPIEGAAADRYTVTAADLGHALACEVTAAGASSASSAVTVPQPPVNRVLPAVSGAPRLGGAVTCSRGGWDDDGVPAYAVAYQWLRDGESLALATAPTYTVALADAGHALACRVTAAGRTEAESASVAVTDPVNRALPRIAGEPRLGRALTCVPGTWDAGDYPYEYAWLRDGTPVATRAIGTADGDAPTAAAAATAVDGDTPIAAGATYTVVAADIGAPLRCRVAAHGRTSATSAPVVATPPRSLTPPAIVGDARLGRTLTCSSGDWDGDYAYTFEWLRDGAAVSSGATLTVAAADVLHELRCRVRAAGLATADSLAVHPPLPRSLVAPTISGDPRPGQPLTCGSGAWDGVYTFTYAWFRGDGTPVGNAAVYTVAAADTVLNCRATAPGLATASSPNVTVSVPSGGAPPENRTPPALTGEPRLRGTAACATGTWNGTYAFTYRWLRNGVAIAGATQATYVVVAADVGQPLRCEVTTGGVSAVSQSVVIAAPLATTAPTVSGDPRPRATLHCSSGSWDDGQYLFTYQWLRDGTAVGGATAATRGADPADVGHELACEVRADGLSPTRSAAVTVRAPKSLVAPAVDGDPHVGRVLTCDPGGWDDAAGSRYALTYRWLRDAVLVGEAATRTVVAADLAKPLTCEVRAEGVSPTVSAPVTPRPPESLVAPALTGTPRIGGTLTCGDGTWDAAYPITVRRWLRAGVAIAGETGATYRVVAADVGRAITCEATAAGLNAAVSSPLAPAAPAVVHAPRIEGDRRIGTTLTCAPGEWDGVYALTYRWLRGGVAAGTASTLAVGRADAGAEYVCEVTAEGLTVAASEPATVDAPLALTPPRISGTPQLRGTLECLRGVWDDTAATRYAVTYHWLKDGVAIAGATTPRLGPFGRADLGATYSCAVTAEGLTTEHAEGVEVAVPQILRDSPEVQGRGYVGRQLFCTRGVWNDSENLPYAVSYRWERALENDWKPIPGADRDTYTPQRSDLNWGVRCVVTAEGEFAVETFGPSIGWSPIETTVTAAADTVAPGGEDGYTLTLRNPNPDDLSLSYPYLEIPSSFTYKPGSTTGATTADPQISTGFGGTFLSWRQGLFVPAGGALTLSLRVVVGATAGDFFADGGGSTPCCTVFVNRSGGGHIGVEAPFDETTCTLRGTAGDDVLTGTAARDVLCGLGGNDVLRGGAGNDVVFGGPGDDRLDGGDGDDTLLGGAGSDILTADAGADVLRGGGGLDTANYSARTLPVRLTLGDDDNLDRDGAVVAHDDGTYVRVDDDGDGEIDGDDPVQTREGDDVGADVEIARGGRGDDQLVGSPSDEELYGGAGSDTIDARDGSNLIDGGDGDDWLQAGYNAHERVFCGNGLDHYRTSDDDLAVGCEIYWNSEGAS